MNDINPYKNQFLLDPSITFLNFGSFGACPKEIFEEYQRIQLELEREPVQFIVFDGPEKLRDSRNILGKYLGVSGDDLVYVTNPSYAVNIIAKNLNLKEGDELLSTNLEYGACDKTWEYYANKKGFNYVKQPITLPLTDKETFVSDFFKGMNKNTKAIFISHITSSTALRFPVEEICRIAKEKGLITIVDGAHAPAQIKLDISEIEADYYLGACHKWMMAPKGASFLYVKKEFQNNLDPLIISWGYGNDAIVESKLIDYHQMQGTRDISAFLTIPKCIEFMTKNNWTEVTSNCKKIVRENAQRFAELMNTECLAPINEDFIGQILSLKITFGKPELLQKKLFDNFKIEIPVMKHGNDYYLRFSINGFNSQRDLDQLYSAINSMQSS
ncbi:MAG: aminotransferase class V-fold PLP-dependent enzyme [Bacteroidia bacterium]